MCLCWCSFRDRNQRSRRSARPLALRSRSSRHSPFTLLARRTTMRSLFNRKATRITMALACIAVTGQTAAAQAKAGTAGSFGLGYTDVGVVVGLGGVGGASASFGGRFEHAVKALPELANGILGIQAAFDYYSWSGGTGIGGYTWKYIPIGVTANYHFKL